MGYNEKQIARSVSKYLQTLCNRAWSKMTEVRLTRGDKEADELEEAIRFLDSLREECKLLAY